MKRINFYKIALTISIICLLSSLIFLFNGHPSKAGPLLITFFMTLAIGIRGFQTFKSFSYTIWIFTAVTASMFYPQIFISFGSFKLQTLIVPLLQIIMFGMGSQMSFNDFAGIIKMPKGVIIGVCSQFAIMPLVGFCISRIFNFPPEIAAGIILIGCVPSGLASNVMSYISRANLALAVTIGAITTILSPFITPLLMKLLAGQYIEVNFWKMMLDILNMIILPIVAGFIFNLFFLRKESKRSRIIQMTSYLVFIFLTNMVFMKVMNAGTTDLITHFARSMCWFYFLPMIGAIIIRYLLKGDNAWLGKILSLISMAGIAVIITIITAAGHNSLLNVGAFLIITSLLHNITGYGLGYTVSWLLGLPERDRRTIAFEVGMQNGGLASGLALQMGKIATVGLAPAIFGPLMNVTGSALASWWRARPPEDEKSAIT